MILQILNELAATSSRLEKEAILKREVNNELLKRVFFLAYDPFTQFYIRKIPKYETTLKIDFITLDESMNGPSGLSHLSSRILTGNAGISHLQFLLSMSSADDAKVIERIISKDLKCGASESTANKIWPNLIHEYPCMLCTPFDEKLINKMKFPAMVQLKMDGMRFNAIVKDGKCEFRSRNGKEINLLENLEQQFITLANGKYVVFDGELIVEENGKILDRQTGNGILNKAVKGTISAAEAAKVSATLWDIIPYENFMAGVSNHTYQTRFGVLESLPLSGRIRLVENKIVESFDDARTLFESYLAEGQEGIILKDLSGIWQDKRVKTQVKFKAELDCDLRIVGIQPGTGKYEGLVGALLCESEDGIIKVDVGSGLSDDDRKDFTNDSPVGKIATVLYNARIKNKQGEESLFLPRLVEIREDKNIADLSEKIR
jgi:ATP-dependent DNA ligase